jgi:hypothetical protein
MALSGVGSSGSLLSLGRILGVVCEPAQGRMIWVASPSPLVARAPEVASATILAVERFQRVMS